MSRPRLIFVAIFAAMAAVYLAMVGWALPHLKELAGGLDPFDLRPFGYDAAEARALLSALGEGGGDFYLNVQHRLDTAYPALLAVVLVLSFRALSRGVVLGFLVGVSVLAAVFDYLENLAVRDMLLAGPEGTTEAMAAAASRWTVLKSAAVTIALVALSILLVRRWFGRSGSAA